MRRLPRFILGNTTTYLYRYAVPAEELDLDRVIETAEEGHSTIHFPDSVLDVEES